MASPRPVRTVFVVNRWAIDEGLPKGLSGAPFIINEAGDFDIRANEYLWARRNGDWSPANPMQGRDLRAHGRKVLRAELNYLRDRAYQLNVLRRWLDREGVDYRNVDEVTLDLYGEELEDGLTAGKAGLQPSSVNNYLLSAIDFLNFGAERGWRGRLVLGSSTKGRSCNHSGKKARDGELLLMRRVNPAEIEAWYNEDEIEHFLGEFETAPAALAARIIHRTGLRIAEVLSLTNVSFPTLAEFRKDRARRFISVIGKFGTRRRVPLDEHVVRAVERFKEFDRKRYARRLAVESNALLIGDGVNGATAPLKARYLQKQFAQARHAAGFSALSPHLLRHHFAAHFLLREWRQKATVLSIDPRKFDVASGKGVLSSELLRLKRALGHKSLDTTVKYLNGVAYLMDSTLAEEYSDELDGVAE